MEFRKMVTITLYARQKKRHRCIEQTCGLGAKARVGWSERTALKPVYYQVWNRSPVQVGCMRQVLGAGALGWPRGMGWGGRWKGGSGWETHVNPWLTHVNLWQKPLQYCKVISLQLIKKKNRVCLPKHGGRGFDPWAGRIPHSERQPSTGTTASGFCNRRNHSEKSTHGWRGSPSLQLEKAHMQQQRPAQPYIKLKTENILLILNI